MAMPGPWEYKEDIEESLRSEPFKGNHCPDCGKNLETVKVQGHYGSCSIGKIGYPSGLCTCGIPQSKEYLHKYDGSPCKWLFRTDL
jgi:hypothetical protein